MALVNYPCAACDVRHRETVQVDYSMPILEDRCSAQYKQANGKWRVCHARFALFGGPVMVADARLCQPCWDRQITGHTQDAIKAIRHAYGGEE